jgi:hypothetical protein
MNEGQDGNDQNDGSHTVAEKEMSAGNQTFFFSVFLN